MNNTPSELTIRREMWEAAGVGLFSFVLTIFAVPQYLVWGDSPELAGSAWVLGIPHPTGYPLYMVLLRAFQCLPLGSVIFRAHLFSTLCSALTVSVLYITIKQLIKDSDSDWIAKKSAFLTAIAYHLTPVVWDQAVVAEVYALFALLFVLTLYFLIRFIQNPHHRLWPITLLLGLQMVHHRLAIFLIFFTIIILLIRCSSRLSRWARLSRIDHKPDFSKSLFKAFIAFILPLLFLIYFPLRAMMDPPINWFDPDSLSGFWALISGGQFSTIATRGFVLFFYHFELGYVIKMFSLAIACYGPLALLILWGFYRLILRITWLGAFNLCLFLVYQGFFMIYRTGDWQVFLLPSILLLTLPCAVGLADALKGLARTDIRPAIRYVAYVGLIALALFPMCLSFNTRDYGYPMTMEPISARYQRANDTSALDYANGVWEYTQPGQPIITGLYENTADNEYFPLLYQQVVEGRGNDSTIIGAGFLFYDWYREQINRQTSLDLPMNNDQLLPSRQAWLDETWRTVVKPLLNEGPVIVTTQHIPRGWYGKANIQELRRIEIDRGAVPYPYLPYVPSGFIYQIEKKEVE